MIHCIRLCHKHERWRFTEITTCCSRRSTNISLIDYSDTMIFIHSFIPSRVPEDFIPIWLPCP